MQEFNYDLNEKDSSNQGNYFGRLEIVYNNDFMFYFIDNKKGLIRERKVGVNYTHKGVKIGKALRSKFENNSTIVFENINFNNYATYQPDLLFHTIFESVFNINIWDL